MLPVGGSKGIGQNNYNETSPEQSDESRLAKV